MGATVETISGRLPSERSQPHTTCVDRITDYHYAIHASGGTLALKRWPSARAWIFASLSSGILQQQPAATPPRLRRFGLGYYRYLTGLGGSGLRRPRRGALDRARIKVDAKEARQYLCLRGWIRMPMWYVNANGSASTNAWEPPFILDISAIVRDGRIL